MVGAMSELVKQRKSKIHWVCQKRLRLQFVKRMPHIPSVHYKVNIHLLTRDPETEILDTIRELGISRLFRLVHWLERVTVYHATACVIKSN